MNLNSLWKTILQEIQNKTSPGHFQTLFKKSELLSFRDNEAVISVNNPLIKNLILTRHQDLILNLLKQYSGIKNEIKIVLTTALPKRAPEKNDKMPLFAPLLNSENQILNSGLLKKLNPDYTFANFAVGSSNQLAHAAATAVSNKLGKSYNPLFLWGGVGVGKTHLMQAVAWESLRKKPSLRLVYCPGENFTNEIIVAIQERTTKYFREKYRKASLLLIDDVQSIAGKDTVQEEFFHTFNAIHSEGGQIILTSDRQPAEIPKLEDRLRNRFEAGLIADMADPDFEMRAAILLIKARQRKIDLPIDVAKTIASSITNPRRLEGVLTRLAAYKEHLSAAIDPDLVAKIIGNGSQTKDFLAAGRPNPTDIIETVSDFYHTKSTQIKGAKREKSIVLPRQVIMFFLRHEMGLPLMEVGNLLGGRDHTTIMHGVKKIIALLAIDPRLKNEINLLKNKMKGLSTP